MTSSGRHQGWVQQGSSKTVGMLISLETGDSVPAHAARQLSMFPKKTLVFCAEVDWKI
jgi:hypothetical protein